MSKIKDYQGVLNSLMGVSLAFVGGYYAKDLPSVVFVTLIVCSSILVIREVWIMGGHNMSESQKEINHSKKIVNIKLPCDIDKAFLLANCSWGKGGWIPSFSMEYYEMSALDQEKLRVFGVKHGVKDVHFLANKVLQAYEIGLVRG